MNGRQRDAILEFIQSTYVASEEFCLRCRITFLSLTYNHFLDANYVADVCMGPMFWFVDTFTSAIGALLVIMVTALTCSVVFIAYWIGIPYWWKKSSSTCIILIIFGHWLLLNVCFNYYMAWKTHPGVPPEATGDENDKVSEVIGICKKCIAPKPPRTHHCSVCNECILKMDHHCPWLNNCVGFRNHRYFFLYMAFTVTGVCFLILAGWEIAYKIIILHHFDFDFEFELEGHPLSLNATEAFVPLKETTILNTLDGQVSQPAHRHKRKAMVYMALINLGVLFALGALTAWHSLLITRGETSIEMHVNRNETLRLLKLGKSYRNPYDFGPRRNWKIFLGLTDERTFWTHILFPSTHEPFGDGLTWVTVEEEEMKLKRKEFCGNGLPSSEEIELIFKFCNYTTTDKNTKN